LEREKWSGENVERKATVVAGSLRDHFLFTCDWFEMLDHDWSIFINSRHDRYCGCSEQACPSDDVLLLEIGNGAFTDGPVSWN
jgi:hypothetical protein